MQCVGKCDRSATWTISPAMVGADVANLVMRQGQKIVEPSQFEEQLQRRRMDRIAAKVAEEIRIFLEHGYVDSGTRQQHAEHHAAGAPSDDADVGRAPSRIAHAATTFKSLSGT